jgi:hypothetical protein
MQAKSSQPPDHYLHHFVLFISLACITSGAVYAHGAPPRLAKKAAGVMKAATLLLRAMDVPAPPHRSSAQTAGSIKVKDLCSLGADFSDILAPKFEVTKGAARGRDIQDRAANSFGYLLSVASARTARAQGAPLLISEPNSTRAVALESVTFRREPFPLTSSIPWAHDPRTRVMLFATNLNLSPDEDLSVLTADAEDVTRRVYPLRVEYVGKALGVEWLSPVIVRLNDDLSEAGDVLVRIYRRGVASNRVRIGIGHTGGGPPDDRGSVPTPAPPTPTPTPPPPPPPVGQSRSRGYFTTPQELASIAQKADQGRQPYKGAKDSLLSIVGRPSDWPYGIVDPRDRDALHKAAALVYGKALAYHLTGDGEYAASAREKILQLSTTSTCVEDYSGANECILTLSRHTPGYVAAADLLEDYPGWGQADKTAFQTWLAARVYRFTDWASDERGTNWGSVGSAATAVIADYFAGSGLTLTDRGGKGLTAEEAYQEAKQRGLDRMNGNSYMYQSVCRPYEVTVGIKDHGGIPEELGRGSAGCDGAYLLGGTDSSWSYMQASLSGIVMQAELHLRRGDSSLYDNMTSAGKGSILRAIHFLIQNPVSPNHSRDWLESRKSILEFAYRYYRDPAMAKQLRVGSPDRHVARDGNSAFPHFGTLTHGFAVDENPGSPAAVPPPGPDR